MPKKKNLHLQLHLRAKSREREKKGDLLHASSFSSLASCDKGILFL